MKCPESTLLDSNMMDSLNVNDQWGVYPRVITISGIEHTTSDIPTNKVGTSQTLTIYDESGESTVFNGIVLNQNATLVNTVTGSGSTTKTFEMDYTLVDKSYWWNGQTFQYEQEVDSNGVTLTNFVSALATATEAVITIPSELYNERYASISYEGTISGALDYLGRLIGLLPFYDKDSNVIVYTNASDSATLTADSNWLAVEYKSPSFDYNGIIVSGNLNHPPAPVNSVEGSELPTEFSFPIEAWEFLGVNGESGPALIPYAIEGKTTLKSGDTTTTVDTTGLAFYAEAFLTYRWTPRGVILRNFGLSVENRQCEKVWMGIDSFGRSMYQTQCNEENNGTVKIIDDSTLSSGNVVDALNFKEPDPSQYPDGFTEWFAVFKSSNDSSNQVINLICHRFWDLNAIITTSETTNGSTTSYDVSLENSIKPLLWQAITESKTFASQIVLKIDYGSSQQIIFPYNIAVGSEPFTQENNNDVANIQLATQYGQTFLNTSHASIMSYTKAGIVPLVDNGKYYTMSRNIYWRSSYDSIITKVEVKNNE